MNPGELQKYISSHFPFTPSQMDAKTRVLRASGLLTKRGYGRHAGDVDAQDAVNLVLGLCAPTIDKCDEFAIKYNKLKAAGDDKSGFAGCATFGEAFEATLEKSELANVITSIIITIDWPHAVIEIDDGRTFEYGFADATSASKSSFQTYGASHQFRISGGVLSQLALDLKEDIRTTGGWVVDADSKAG